jgi:hypothetical protein
VRNGRLVRKKKWGLGSLVSGIKSIGSSIGNALSGAANAVGGAAVGAANAVGGAAVGAVNAVEGAVATAANKVIDEGKAMVDKLADKLDPNVNHGEGSWKTGFDCPHIKIGIDDKTLTSEGRGTFFPEQLIKPDTVPEKLGWVFDMRKQAPGTNLKKVMIQFEQTSFWFIPFSYFIGDFKFVNPLGYKYIEGKIKTPSNEQYLIRIDLPWKAVGWYISDEEGTKVAEILNAKQKEFLITSNRWKIVATWTDKKYNLDLKLPIRKYGKVKIKSYKDGPTEMESIRWGDSDNLSGGLTQSAEIDTTGFENNDSVQFFIANYTFDQLSIIDSGVTVSLYNGDQKLKTLTVPKTGSKTFPYWYVGHLFKYGLIIENELDTKQQDVKKMRFRLRLRRIRRWRRLFIHHK